MKTRLVITDVTRMHHGRVCFAGYDDYHHCVRPVLPPPGIPESALVKDGNPIIYPFALVELELLRARPQPPHTEDYDYRAISPVHLGQVDNRREVLAWSLFNYVSEIFGQEVHTDFGYYVMECQGSRSLGTIKPVEIERVLYGQGEEETWDYRLAFVDSSGSRYRLKITDLAWQYFCGSLRGEDHDPAKIAADLTGRLKSMEVFVRIGLARGWSKFPERCYLQITGIYTFPDYLAGKTFYDFAPNRIS